MAARQISTTRIFSRFARRRSRTNRSITQNKIAPTPGHRVDGQLERLPGALAGLRRVAHVRRLVVRDHDELGREAERGLDDIGATCAASLSPQAPAVRPRGVRGTMSTRSNRPRMRSPSRLKREVALDVGRDDRAGPQLLLAEPAQRRPARRPGAPPRARARGTPRWTTPPSNAANSSSSVMTSPRAWRLWNSETARWSADAVDDRVVRRDRHPQDVRVLVLERAGQVVVDLRRS